MTWHARNLWMLLGIFVALVALALTRWITHVDHAPKPFLSFVFDERPVFQFENVPFTFSAMQRVRNRLPEVALVGRSKVLFLATPATRSISMAGAGLAGASCNAISGENGATALLAGVETNAASVPITLQTTRDGVVIPIPDAMRRELARNPDGRGAIVCELGRQLAVSPTFTERAATVRASSGAGGAVMVDVSALEDVEEIRFSGGLQALLGGDRARLLEGGNDVVSAEWVDAMAQEQRDIVLVLIGALSAIAAAMIIEGIRPFVESRSKKPD
jgi:hypothetical protein